EGGAAGGGGWCAARTTLGGLFWSRTRLIAPRLVLAPADDGRAHPLRLPGLTLRAPRAHRAPREGAHLDDAHRRSHPHGAEAAGVPGAQSERARPDARARGPCPLRVDRHHRVPGRRLPDATTLPRGSVGACAGEDVAGG